MTEAKFNTLLLEAFPELTDKFEEYTSWQDGIDTGCFLTYEDLLLKELISAFGNNDDSLIERGCAFIERLITSEDEYARNLAYVGLLEGLKAQVGASARASLGPVSLREFDAMVY